MRRVCLTLPTNRPCSPTLAAVAGEATYAAEHFGVEVHLLVLDSAETSAYADHARTLNRLPAHPRVVVHHLDEDAQRDFLTRAVNRSGAPGPGLLLELMLPARLSYGACTNRAFLIAAALGCTSVHRRDSDSSYQTRDGEPLYPIRPELDTIGRPASEVAAVVDETTFADPVPTAAVAMVGASFVGELSVDLGEILGLDPVAYHDLVSLWAPSDWTAEQKRELVAESFRGSGDRLVTRDHSTLGVVDPMRVDMCNIAFHGVQEQVPLPPATDTIGSDYFLMHLVHDAGLPGVLHERDIVNFYTGERRTDAGFAAYQLRFVRFLLSMLYFNAFYDRMAQAGPALLDDDGRVRTARIAELAREVAALDRRENVVRLETADAAYRRLGGRYAAFADSLLDRREQVLAQAKSDLEDFGFLTEHWPALIVAARETAVPGPALAGAGRTA